MSYQVDLRNNINERIVKALSEGLPPWRKPWVAGKNAGHPANAVSTRSYRGINSILLRLAEYHSKWWATYGQWRSLGGQVRRGEHGTRIVFWSPVKKVRTDDNGEEKVSTFPLLREYVVFNSEQCDGVERLQILPSDGLCVPDFDPAERVIAAVGADIRHVAADEACYYRPPLDYIQMPLKSQFENGPFGLPGYYETCFHELLHHSESRLGWTGSYSLGELRAELGSTYLAAEVGIPTSDSLENHAKYVDSWLKTMKADSRVIFQVASAASKGADWILSFSREAVPEEQGELATS